MFFPACPKKRVYFYLGIFVTQRTILRDLLEMELRFAQHDLALPIPICEDVYFESLDMHCPTLEPHSFVQGLANSGKIGVLLGGMSVGEAKLELAVYWERFRISDPLC